MSKLERKIQKHQAKRDRNTFYDDDLLFFAIDAALGNPEVNTIIVEEKNGKEAVILRGPDPKSKIHLKMVCARGTQLETIKKKYQEYLTRLTEFEARLERASGYRLDSFERISFQSQEEWERAWSTPDQEFRISEAHYDYYMRKEVWANDEYWAVLDKLCEIGTHTLFLGYALWHLSIRRRNEKPLHEWPIIQGIKNKVVGEEFEAIELYPADSRIMDIGNVRHLWIIAPKKGETGPPRFPLGAKNPEKGGVVVLGAKQPVLLCTERTKRAFDSGEMSLDERKELVEASKTHFLLFIFPDASMPDAEKEFPGQEPLRLMQQYVLRHPEVVQRWEPQLCDTTHTTIPSLNSAA